MDDENDKRIDETEITAEDLPNADEADVKPSVTDAGEPEPFDPYKDTAPTQESVAADLKTATSEGVEDKPEESKQPEEESEHPEESKQPETPEQPEEPKPAEPAKTPEPEEKIDAPEPQIIEDKSSKRFVIFIIIAAVIVVGCVAAGIFLLGPAIFGGRISNGGGGSVRQRYEEEGHSVDLPEKNNYKDVLGVWQTPTEGGECYIFTPANTFYILQSCGDFNDNYRYGTVESKTGTDALEDLGLTKEQLAETLALGINDFMLPDIHSLTLTQSEQVAGGANIDEEVPTITKIGFVRTRGAEAKAYFPDSDASVQLAKRTDIQVPTRLKCGQSFFDFENLDNNKSCSAPDIED